MNYHSGIVFFVSPLILHIFQSLRLNEGYKSVSQISMIFREKTGRVVCCARQVYDVFSSGKCHIKTPSITHAHGR